MKVNYDSGKSDSLGFTPAEEYAQWLSTGTLATAGRFAIYGGDRNVEFWRRWFAARPELRHWRNEKLGSFGDVEVAVFSKAGA